MDKLSTPGANCFEAVFGVYKSLKRLHDHELEALQSLRSQEDKPSKVSPATQVMCTKSGRPRMHARDRVGLSLEYWVNRSNTPRTTTRKPDDAMDVDEDTDADGTSEDDHVRSITIECEHAPPALYSPIRISDGWISDRTVIPHDENTGSEPNAAPQTYSDLIDWQQPPPTYQTPANESDRTTPTPLLPHARFVAHFEPPVVLTIHLAANIYANVGLNLQSAGFVASPYDKLLLTDLTKEERTPTAPPPSEYPYTRTTTHSTVLPTTNPTSNSSEQMTRYTTRIFTPRAEHSLTIQQIPFEHPRQIVAILPVLRQFARFNTIVRQSYQPGIPSASPPKPLAPPAAPESYPARRTARKRPFDTAFPFNTTSTSNANVNANADPADDELDAFLKAAPQTKVPQIIDMTYSVLPSPVIELTFPTAAGLKFVRFGIGLGGVVAVVAQDVLEGDGGLEVDGEAKDGGENEDNGEGRNGGEGKGGRGNDEVKTKIKKMAKALEVCEDVSFWVVWCRRVLLGEEMDVEVEAEAEVVDGVGR